MKVALADIRTDGGTQPRAAIDFGVVEEYALAMGQGAAFPPLTVFYDGEAYWLADGFHRKHAGESLGLIEIDCDVRQGTRRDAVLFSVGANISHGLRRTNADKRRAILTLINDEKWSGWSDNEIAKRCSVDQKTVTALRPVTSEIRSERTYTTKHGTVATMNTARIGSTPRAKPDTPVFDNTPMGGAKHDPEPAPVDLRQAERDRQIEHDNAHSDLFWAIKQVREHMDSLPSPDEFARLFPSGLRYTVTADQLRAWAKWFSAAADVWDANNGALNVAAE